MSLINEALKRAERDKLDRDAGTSPFFTYAVMRDALARANRPRSRSGLGWRIVKVALIAAIPAVCAGLWIAAGAVAVPGDGARPTAIDAAVQLGQSADPTLALSNDGIARARCLVQPASTAHSPVTAKKPAAMKEPVVTPVAGKSVTVQQSPAPGTAVVTAGKAAVQDGPAVKPPAPAAAPAAAPAGDSAGTDTGGYAVVRRADYKLTAVVRGPTGTTAIINGSFLQVGDTVGDAKVTRIGQNSVELLVGGRIIRIQM